MDKISLKAARINAGYSLLKVAGILNRAPSTISQWENGNTEPSVSDALKMAELYGRQIETIEFKEARE